MGQKLPIWPLPDGYPPRAGPVAPEPQGASDGAVAPPPTSVGAPSPEGAAPRPQEGQQQTGVGTMGGPCQGRGVGDPTIEQPEAPVPGQSVLKFIKCLLSTYCVRRQSGAVEQPRAQPPPHPLLLTAHPYQPTGKFVSYRFFPQGSETPRNPGNPGARLAGAGRGPPLEAWVPAASDLGAPVSSTRTGAGAPAPPLGPSLDEVTPELGAHADVGLSPPGGIRPSTVNPDPGATMGLPSFKAPQPLPEGPEHLPTGEAVALDTQAPPLQLTARLRGVLCASPSAGEGDRWDGVPTPPGTPPAECKP
ncbi:basic salivary proline-rich protein 1-like [Choloepus didactylus]|uniref:basic salivary proline-rich protein 1-like n=1 Tax=Choloepus didactylus TaxID=27675 RepID=UPI00189F62FF|nr:basic salivary proline-rich protein 1-like [Choloepus didactylus]